jgi:hypothetical protein
MLSELRRPTSKIVPDLKVIGLGQSRGRKHSRANWFVCLDCNSFTFLFNIAVWVLSLFAARSKKHAELLEH